MTVVGGAGKGKTTLLHLLINEHQSSVKMDNTATLGVHIRKWMYVLIMIDVSVFTVFTVITNDLVFNILSIVGTLLDKKSFIVHINAS